MTEREWLECRQPNPMLAFLRGKFGGRKARLFCAACCRAVWSAIVEPEFRAAVEASERIADDPAAKQSWEVALEATRNIWDAEFEIGAGKGPTRPGRYHRAAAAMESAGERVYPEAMVGAIAEIAGEIEYENPPTVGDSHESPHFIYVSFSGPITDGQCHLLRDIVGNPFRPVAVEQRWLTADIVAVARYVYEERDFDHLPVLADVLIDAGCTDDAILAHCHQPGPHVRGCWAVDLLLGKS